VAFFSLHLSRSLVYNMFMISFNIDLRDIELLKKNYEEIVIVPFIVVG